MNLKQLVHNLPTELADLVRTFIPVHSKRLLNKTYYVANHSAIKVPANNIQTYVRKTIRQDHDFVFTQIVKEKYKQFLTQANYHYKNTIYLNYLYFLRAYCLENESPRCYKLLNDLMKSNIEKRGGLRSTNRKRSSSF